MRWDTLDKFPTSRLGRLRHCVTHRGDHRQIHANNPTVRIFQVQCCVFIFFHEMCCCCWSWESPLVWHISFSTWHWHSPSLGLKELCDAYSLARREYYFDRLPLFLSINANLAQFSANFLGCCFLFWCDTCIHVDMHTLYVFIIDWILLRSPRNFDSILGLYRTGKLHLSQGVRHWQQHYSQIAFAFSLQLNYSFPFPTRFFC